MVRTAVNDYTKFNWVLQHGENLSRVSNFAIMYK